MKSRKVLLFSSGAQEVQSQGGNKVSVLMTACLYRLCLQCVPTWQKVQIASLRPLLSNYSSHSWLNYLQRPYLLKPPPGGVRSHVRIQETHDTASSHHLGAREKFYPMNCEEPWGSLPRRENAKMTAAFSDLDLQRSTELSGTTVLLDFPLCLHWPFLFFI